MTNGNDLITAPHPDYIRNRDLGENIGTSLTKREYFTALAMQGMLANPQCIAAMLEAGMTPENSGSFLAIASVEQADAIIEQLNK